MAAGARGAHECAGVAAGPLPPCRPPPALHRHGEVGAPPAQASLSQPATSPAKAHCGPRQGHHPAFHGLLCNWSCPGLASRGCGSRGALAIASACAVWLCMCVTLRRKQHNETPAVAQPPGWTHWLLMAQFKFPHAQITHLAVAAACKTHRPASQVWQCTTAAAKQLWCRRRHTQTHRTGDGQHHQRHNAN